MSKIEDFLSKLTAQTATTTMTRSEFKDRPRNNIERIPLSFAGNFGRYQVCPINSKITDFPFVSLPNTREVAIPRKLMKEDGSYEIKNLWVKILPADAYRRKENGMEFSGLTNEDAALLQKVQTLYDELEAEMDLRNNDALRKEVGYNMLRKKNYTIFYAYCLRKWTLENSRIPSRENFIGLFYSTSKGFLAAIDNNVGEEVTLSNGDNTWYEDCYCADVKQRRGFLVFTIGPRTDGRPGFQISAQHKYGTPLQISVSDEVLSQYNNPVLTFLGWQALKEDKPDVERKLFNAELHEEVARFLAQQLAAVRAAKQVGGDLLNAVQETNKLAQQAAPTFGNRSNDPVLNQQASAADGNFAAAPSNPQRVVEQNTDPFASAPAAHFNPAGNVAAGGYTPNPAPAQPSQGSGFGAFQQGPAQAQPQAAPFQKPAFASGFGAGVNVNPANDNSGIPF